MQSYALTSIHIKKAYNYPVSLNATQVERKCAVLTSAQHPGTVINTQTRMINHESVKEKYKTPHMVCL